MTDEEKPIADRKTVLEQKFNELGIKPFTNAEINSLPPESKLDELHLRMDQLGNQIFDPLKEIDTSVENIRPWGELVVPDIVDRDALDVRVLAYFKAAYDFNISKGKNIAETYRKAYWVLYKGENVNATPDDKNALNVCVQLIAQYVGDYSSPEINPGPYFNLKYHFKIVENIKTRFNI